MTTEGVPGAGVAGGPAAEAAPHDPLHQFEIVPIKHFELFGYDVSFTNSSLMMVAAALLIPAFFMFAMRDRSLIPTRLQSIAELCYEYIANMVRDVIGDEGMKYFPWIFTLFIFVLTLNMLGMIPGMFTSTSHIIVTFGLAFMVWLTATAIGFIKHGVGYLRLFVPAGVPPLLLLVIVPIELISYFIRPISHSVRLFANMMAGHTMLKVFGGFAVSLPVWAKLAPAGFMVAFTGLEFMVAFLQALVFTLLTCIYINDAVNMHH